MIAFQRLPAALLALLILFTFIPADFVAAQSNTVLQQQRMMQSQRATQQSLQAQRNAAQARIRQQEQARILRQQQRVQREQQRIQRQQQQVQRQQQRAQREQLLKQRELQRAQREQQRAERATQQAARAQEQARRSQQQQSDAKRKRQETEARTAILTRQQTTAIRSQLAALPKPPKHPPHTPANESRSLKFGKNDLVYGPAANGALARLAKSAGGRTLNDEMVGRKSTTPVGIFSKQKLAEAANIGRQVHFDLTHIKNLKGVLNNQGEYAKTYTSQELRYIRDNWRHFKVKPKFYKGGIEIPPPWL